jgi:hypothetical protein
MSERIDTRTAATTIDPRTFGAGMTEDDGKGATAAGGAGIRFVRLLVGINLGLVGLQAISAGAFLSGFPHAVAAHAGVSIALQLGALIQAVTGIVLWRRRRVPVWVMGASLGLLAVVLLQAGLGRSHRYWLHVPIGVGLFGGLMRQGSRLDMLRRGPNAT